ncbi:hypothetical protein AB0A67_11065, partial [Streptomyces eurythermus]
MVTYAQAQERAEEWINGDVPVYQHREVRVREFGLGFVVWGEDRAEGPRSDAGGQRLVIARDSGEATLWPALPVGEVIRRYEEEYGRAGEPQDAVPAPARLDLNQTSFLLTPPEWLQEAADKLGNAEGGAGDSAGPAGSAGPSVSGGSSGSADSADLTVGAASAGAGVPGTGAPGAGSVSSGSVPSGSGVPGSAGAPGPASGSVPASASVEPGGGAASGVPGAPGEPGVPASAEVPEGATPWAGTDTNAEVGEDDRSVPLPATVFAPPLSDSDDGPRPPAVAADAPTALMSGGSQLPPTAVAPALDTSGTPTAGRSDTPPPVPGASAYGHPQAPATPGTPAPGVPPYPPAHGTPPPPPPMASGAPGAPQGSTPPPPVPSYGYPQAPGGAPQPPAGPGAPARPLPPHAGDIADAATSKAAPPPKKGRGGVGLAVVGEPGAVGGDQLGGVEDGVAVALRVAV